MYAKYKGWQNYLWFSQYGLLGAVFALWLESSLLTSMLALAVVLGDLAWFALLCVRLIRRPRNKKVFPNSEGMPPFIKAMSLFHPLLPLLLLWLVAKLGYDERALLYQTLAAWALLIATYLLTDPERNINFAFGLRGVQKRVHPLIWLALMFAYYPVVVYLPTHLLLAALWG